MTHVTCGLSPSVTMSHERLSVYLGLASIRSFTLLCDHSRSKTIAIRDNLCHYMPCQPVHNCIGLSECQLSLPPHSADYYIQTRRGEGEVGISRSAAAADGALGLCKVLRRLPLTASRNTAFLPSSDRQLPLQPTDGPKVTHPHWCHIASTVAYLWNMRWRAPDQEVDERGHGDGCIVVIFISTDILRQ